MRVLVFGDLAQTGFGTVTMDLGRELVATGVDARFASLNEGPWLDDEQPDWLTGRVLRLGSPDGWLSRPDGPESAAAMVPLIEGIFTSRPWADGWAPEAAVIIGDVGSVKVSPVVRFIPPGFPVYHYVPVEGIALPPLWRTLWQRLTPVAMSEFGADQIERLTGTRPPVVYHGVDTEAFRPATPDRPLTIRAGTTLHVLRSKNDCKRFLGIDPDRVMLFRADRNVPRKRYPSLFRSIAPVLARHPEADFFYHCLSLDQGGDLADERSKYGPLRGWNEDGQPIFGGVAGRINPTGFHDAQRSTPRELLAILYNAADVYVSVCAEGFGLTIAEAIACGTPALALDFSAVPEVVGPAGQCVPVDFYDDNIYSHLWAGVDEPAYAAALERLVSSRALRRELGAKGPIHVGANFRWERAARQFQTIMAGQAAEVAA